MEEDELEFVNNNGDVVLRGNFTQFDIIGGNNGRIYPEDTFKRAIEDYKNKITIDQRDETVDALLEGREVKEILFCLSSRGRLDHEGEYKLLSFDLLSNHGFSDSEISE